MTREEIVDRIWGDAVRRNINIVRDDVVEMVDFVLRKHCPELQGLDEAAKEYNRNYIPFDQCDRRDIIHTFKAGAEWTAGQGFVKETQVYADRWTDVDVVNVSLGQGEYGFKAGDKVIVQIRKK